MKRIVLFSQIEKNANSEDVLDAIFPREMKDKKMLFMPSGGINIKYQHYYDEWEKYCSRYDTSFDLVDNSFLLEDFERISSEIEKIQNSNILVISGGDTFKLLYYLRRSSMDHAIKEFTQKDEFVLAGYSAGAMILAPTIKVTTMEVTDKEGKRVPIFEVRGKIIHPGLENDLTGLKLVDFEFLPHFEEKYANDVQLYKKTTQNQVQTCSDDEYFVIEK